MHALWDYPAAACVFFFALVPAAGRQAGFPLLADRAGVRAQKRNSLTNSENVNLSNNSETFYWYNTHERCSCKNCKVLIGEAYENVFEK